MINLRKLVALDMLLNGTRFILAEFAVGVLLGLALGMLALNGTLFGPVQAVCGRPMGIWLLGIGVNYIPLLIYAVVIARGGSVKEEGEPELPHKKRYTVQQVIVFVPFFIAFLAILQEIRRGR